MALAISFFIASLLGLALLFTLKSIETKRERIFAPRLRENADRAAVSLKYTMIHLRRELAKLPPAFAYMCRFLLHELALAAARLARSAETQLHNAADMISHKRGFEKRPGRSGEPRSEFLKQMQEGRPDESLDANRQEGQNGETR